MKKIFDSPRVEIGVILITILVCLLAALEFTSPTVPAFFCLILTLHYLVQMIGSFRRWKLSKGVSLINFLLNNQAMVCSVGIVFVFAELNDADLMNLASLVLARYVAVVVLVLFIIGSSKGKLRQYFEYTKLSLAKTAFLLTVSFVLSPSLLGPPIS